MSRSLDKRTPDRAVDAIARPKIASGSVAAGVHSSTSASTSDLHEFKEDRPAATVLGNLTSAIKSSAPLGGKELRPGMMGRVCLGLLGGVMFVVGTLFGVMLACAPGANSDAPLVIWVAGLCFFLIGLYGLDIIYRSAIRLDRGHTLFAGKLGFARAFGGSVLFSLGSLGMAYAVGDSIRQGKHIDGNAISGVLFFVGADALFLRGLWWNMRTRYNDR